MDIVNNWSKEWKLSLNASKSETCLFTLDPFEARYSPEILIDGKTLRHNENPIVLGVTLDRTLSFTPHTDTVVDKVSRKQKLLSAVAHSSYGWRKSKLKQLFLAHCQSVMNYAAIAWQPWIWSTNFTKPTENMNKLERAQNRCLRIITTQESSCPVEALQLESNVKSYNSTIRANIMKGSQKIYHLPDDHPRKQCLDRPPIIKFNKTNRENCRTTSNLLSRALPPAANAPESRVPFNPYSVEPWSMRGCISSIYEELPGIKSKKDNPELIATAAYNRISELGTEFAIYTDGSATAGTKDGGSAAVITNGDPRNPNIVEVKKRKGAPITCSYSEEADAMDLAIEWLEANLPESAVVITDSQSLCLALKNYNPDLDRLRNKISSFQQQHILHIQWVPGHCGIAGNERADKAAKEATSLQEPPRPITYKAICSEIRHITKQQDYSTMRDHVKEVYKCLDQLKESTITSKSDQSVLAKVRSGNTILFRSHKSKLDKTTDPTCPLCGEGPHNLNHWMLQCAGTLDRRRREFGEEGMYRLESLSKYPKEAVALIRATLVTESAPGV